MIFKSCEGKKKMEVVARERVLHLDIARLVRVCAVGRRRDVVNLQEAPVPDPGHKPGEKGGFLFDGFIP